MYVCMCGYVCVCVYMCMCVCVCIYICVCVVYVCACGLSVCVLALLRLMHSFTAAALRCAESCSQGVGGEGGTRLVYLRRAVQAYRVLEDATRAA